MSEVMYGVCWPYLWRRCEGGKWREKCSVAPSLADGLQVSQSNHHDMPFHWTKRVALAKVQFVGFQCQSQAVKIRHPNIVPIVHGRYLMNLRW